MGQQNRPSYRQINVCLLESQTAIIYKTGFRYIWLLYASQDSSIERFWPTVTYFLKMLITSQQKGTSTQFVPCVTPHNRHFRHTFHDSHWVLQVSEDTHNS